MKGFQVASVLLLAATMTLEPATARADEEVIVEKPPSGLGMLITGAILTGVGVVNLAAGPPLCLAFYSGSFLGGPPNQDARNACIDAELIVGGVLTAVGVPLLIVGASRQSRFRQWKADHPYAFTMAPTRHGAALGFGWSF